MKNETQFSRRMRLDLMSPAELSIFNAVREVEKIGADIRLTNAVILLGKARDSVADYIDGVDLDESVTLKSSGERGEVERLKGEIERLKEKIEILEIGNKRVDINSPF